MLSGGTWTLDVQQTSDVVRVLRSTAGASIDKHSICDIDIHIR